MPNFRADLDKALENLAGLGGERDREQAAALRARWSTRCSAARCCHRESHR